MTHTPSSRNPLRLLLPAAAVLWLAALGLFLWASHEVATAQKRVRTHQQALRSLNPDLTRFEVYQQTVSALRMNAASSPNLHDWLESGHSAPPPSTANEIRTLREPSGLRMRTETLTWNAISPGQLQTLITAAGAAPAAYRLAAITLAPTGREAALKAECKFHTFTQ